MMVCDCLCVGGWVCVCVCVKGYAPNICLHIPAVEVEFDFISSLAFSHCHLHVSTVMTLVDILEEVLTLFTVAQAVRIGNI